MIKRDIPIFVLLMFTIVYALMGDPSNKVWSGSYFIVNYLTMLSLFIKEKSKPNRIIGISLTITMLIFVMLKYFFNFTYERYYNVFVLVVSILSIYKIDRHV